MRAIGACVRCGIEREVKPGRDYCKDCKPPRPDTLTAHERGVLAHHSLNRAQELACMVRDESHDTIGDFLDRLDTQALYGLVVTLAAMVPVDQSADDLLAWIDWTEEVAA